jgi:hypothetical protein
VLGFLFLLARRLSDPYRLQGPYAAATAFGLYSALFGLWG